MICALRYARRLARRKNDWSQANWLLEKLEELKKSALEHFWDSERRCFVSNGQTSLTSQVWMVLADVLSPEDGAELMQRAEEFMSACPMVTPYMHHYYVMALLRVGLKEKAIDHVRQYWGGMVNVGADTFWEAWDPESPGTSPYGGSIINSFCHGWSCTPAYILKSVYTKGSE